MTKKRIRERFEKDWRFKQENVKNAHRPEYKDAKWRSLNLPHDWSIEGSFDPKDPSAAGGGYLPGGHGWYRKTFNLPEAYAGKKVSIEFDGVYMNATVWLNGRKLGIHHYGYTPFALDLTPYLRFGKKKNVLAVHVNNSRRPNTRWYSGAGIYRHVWMTVTDRVHVAHWGTNISTADVTKSAGTVEVETKVCNDTDSPAKVELTTRIVHPTGKVAGTAVAAKRIRAGGTGTFKQQCRVKKPSLWDVDSPALYRSESTVSVNGKVTDDQVTPFGIRTFRFDAEKGFILNGRRLKLKGVNLHHDNGCLGSVVYDRAEERRVELMKSIGVNAIRTSHNPPSAEFLDACDRLGVVVMDEAFDEWQKGKLKYGYKDYFNKCWRSDLTAMVMRDRNHPCIVLWSIGNEVPEQGKLSGARTAERMARFIRSLDPTRPVGYGAHPGPWTPELWAALDVAGYNYRDDLYAIDKKKYPKRCVLGSETFSLYAFRTWNRALDNKHIIGEFIWTGMDYIGESGIGFALKAHTKYPVNTACCGELDICGFKKTRSYYRDILWNKGSILHVAVRRRLPDREEYHMSPWGWPSAKASWTWPDAIPRWNARGPGEEVQVDVYSACDEVELRINGRTIGRNTTSKASQYMATWMVSYEPGTLEAIGYRKGKKVASQILRTAKDSARLRLSPDRRTIRADGYDLSFVTVEVLDKRGDRHPNADNDIRFRLSGPGEIVGVGNGDQASVESFKLPRRKAYNGRCLVVVKSKEKRGPIKLIATSKGLKSATTNIRTT